MDKLKEPIVPNIAPSDDDIELRQRQLKNRRPTTAAAPRVDSGASSGGNGSGLAIAGLVLALAASGFAGFLFMQLQESGRQLAAAQKQLEDQAANLKLLNERLSVTGENASLSLDALKVMLKEQDGKIRTLLDSTGRHKDMIASNDKDIVFLSSKIKAQAKVDEEQGVRMDQADLAISGQNERLQTLESAVQRIPAETEIRMAQNSELIQNNQQGVRALKDADAVTAKELSTLRTLIKQLDTRITQLHAPQPVTTK